MILLARIESAQRPADHPAIEQAIEAEAQAQALCMLTQDFKRAFDAFAAKRRPTFEGD